MSTELDFNSATSGIRGAPAQTLLDLCTDLFLLALRIRDANEVGHPEDVRRNITMLFQRLERQARAGGRSDEDIKAARYALCALIDETVLNSRWAFRDQWKDRPLALDHFDDLLAGEHFFDLLGRVRKKGRGKADLLEVFCACLIFGFQGKYKLSRQDDLAEATRALVNEVISLRGGRSPLAQHWNIPEERVERPPAGVPRWALITGGGSLVLVALMYVVFKLWLGSAAADAIHIMIF
jgi:type VI secretion system protein ImpK